MKRVNGETRIVCEWKKGDLKSERMNIKKWNLKYLRDRERLVKVHKRISSRMEEAAS